MAPLPHLVTVCVRAARTPPLPFHAALLRVGGGNELASLLADLANDACLALHRVTAIRRLDDACVNRCVTAAAQSPRVIGCMRLL